MKYLTCILLSVFTLLNGGMSEDCSYKSCNDALEIMGLVPALSGAYCTARKTLKKCLEDQVVKCPDTNVEKFAMLLKEYESSEPCPDVSSTSTLMSTSAVVPSSSRITPQATSTPDCLYEVCQAWLGYLGTLDNLTSEYCRVYKELGACVNNTYAECGANNMEIFNTLFIQLSLRPACPKTTSTAAVVVTSTAYKMQSSPTIMSSSIPSPTINLDCTYGDCQTWLSYLNSLEDLSPEYCRAHKKLGVCLADTFVQCGDTNMETFSSVYTQLNMKPECPTTTTVVMNTSVQPSPTVTSSAVPSPTITLDCSFNHCGDLVQRLQGLTISDTNYCRYLREGYDCLDYTRGQCKDNFNFLKYLFHKEILDEYQSCHDTNSITTTLPISSTSATASPTPSCVYGVPTDVAFNNELPDFVPPQIVDNEHKCGIFEQEEDNIYYHCSFYTYSHLRAFRSTDLYTCSSPGLWALFSHPSLQVTALNIVPDLRETYTLADEVNIVIPESRCSQRKIYRVSASRGHLPTTFDDGTDNSDGLQLFVNSNKTSAYLKVPWINTTVAVHKLAGFIGVVILSPQIIADESVGLCSLGCPDHSKFLIEDVPSQRYSDSCRQEAIKACSINEFVVLGESSSSSSTTDDFYIDRCLFDALKSNKANSSWMSVVMVQSLQSLGPIGIPPKEPSTNIPWADDLLNNYQDRTDSSDNDDGYIPNDVSPGLALPLEHKPLEQEEASRSTLTASSSILLMVWCLLPWHAIHYILYT